MFKYQFQKVIKNIKRKFVQKYGSLASFLVERTVSCKIKERKEITK